MKFKIDRRVSKGVGNFFFKSKNYRYKVALFFCLICFFTMILSRGILSIQLPSFQQLSLILYLPESNMSDFIKNKGKRVLLTAPYYGVAERQVYRYISSTLREMGYHPICIYNNAVIRILSNFIDMDVCISSSQGMVCPKNSYNFFILHYGIGQIKKKYDAVLSVVPEEKAKKLYPNGPIVPFFFSVHSTKFCDSPKTRLFFGGDSWDRYRSRDVAKLYKLLDNTGYFDLYGTKSFGLNSYKGFITYGENTVLDAMRKSGVALVLHSEGHFKDDIPTARIFEAIAASTVVITDRLPFIVKNFGDSVLYIDRDKSSEEMFKQIDAHMKWILSHPQKAIELAQRSHEIFLKNFTLERIMKNVMERYENSKKATTD